MYYLESIIFMSIFLYHNLYFAIWSNFNSCNSKIDRVRAEDDLHL